MINRIATLDDRESDLNEEEWKAEEREESRWAADALIAWEARDGDADAGAKLEEGEEEDVVSSGGGGWYISSLNVDALVIPCLLLYAICPDDQ